MARRPISHYRFDPDFPFVVARPITLNGETLQAGADVPPGVINARRMRQLFEAGRIAHKDPDAVDKAWAEKNAARRAGTAPKRPEKAPDDGKINGMTPVPPAQATHTGGGWYVVIDAAGQVLQTKVRKDDALAMAEGINKLAAPAEPEPSVDDPAVGNGEAAAADAEAAAEGGDGDSANVAAAGGEVEGGGTPDTSEVTQAPDGATDAPGDATGGAEVP